MTELAKLQDKCACSSTPASPLSPITIQTTSKEPTTTTSATTTLGTTTPVTTSPLCDEGWTRFNDHCYLAAIEESKSWDDALAFCENRDSYLIELTTDAEREFALDFVGKYMFYGGWTGATDRDTEGRFVHQHSKEQVPENYWRWGQPDNEYGDEHCVYMYWWHIKMQLFDRSCNFPLGFVCEKP